MTGQVMPTTSIAHRLTCAFFLVFGCLVGSATPGAAQSVLPPYFAQAVNYQPGNGQPSSVFIADVNGDGYPDVVAANQSGSNGHGSVDVYFGNGNGTFQAPVTYDSGASGTASVYVIDVNGDGRLDIVVANQGGGKLGNGSVSVLLNNGGGTFAPPVVYDSGGPGTNSVFVVDVNGDGEPDIVVSNYGLANADGSVSVLLNGAAGVSGTFNPAVTYDSGGANATAVTLADVNGDGHPDILVANNCYPLSGCPQQQGGVAVLLNDTTGKFGAATSYATPGPATSIAVGDVNADGKPDLFVGASTYGAGYLAGDGSGNFSPYQAISGVQGQVISVAVRDVNGDAINDLLVGLGYCATCDLSLGSGVTVFPGTGSGNYGSPVTYTVGGDLAVAFALGDLNGDLKPDLVVANQCDDGIIDTLCGGNVAVLLNSVGGQTTTLVASANPALTGQVVVYTANVTAAFGANSPTGTVTFRDGTTVLASAVPLSFNLGQYQAVYSTSYAAAGSHEISATYSLTQVPINPTFSQISPILAENVIASTTSTTTSVVSSSPTSVSGQAVTFTATVTPSQGAIPDGDLITFSDGSSSIGTGTTVGGVATLTSSTLSVGTQTITATFAGDINFASSAGQVTQIVQTIVIPPPSPLISSVTPNSGLQGQQGLSVVIAGANFVVGSTTVTFGGGTSGITVASFTVNSAGSATAVLNIAQNAVPGGYDVVVAVAGASASATLASGFAVISATISINIPEIIHVQDTVFVPPPITLTGIVAPVAYYSAGSLGFVGIAPGQTVTQSLTISNIGLQPLAISGEGIAQDASNSFSVTQVQCTDGTYSLTVTLASGGSCTLTISYTAPASGTPGGTVTFTDNAGLSNLTSTALGSSFTQTLLLSSTVATTAPPSAPPTTITISVPETIHVMDSVFAPPPITLTGIGAPVAYYSAGSLGFVGIAPGQTVTQPLTVSNIGLQPLAISAEGITQDASSSFSVTQVQCTTGANSITVTLPSGGECTLTISYTAPLSGTPSGTIGFTDDAALSNLTSAASGSSFTQSLALSTTVATTAAPPAPPTTITISISEPIKVNDQVGVVTLKTIAVTPASSTIPEGATQPFTATGTFSDGSTQNLTAAATWSSSAPTVATMSGNVATGLAYGLSTITAKLGNASGSTTLTVLSYLTITAKLASITLDTKGEYVVKISVTNNGNSNASKVAIIAGLLGTKTPTSSVSATNVAPGATGTVTLVFPASAGKQLSKQPLLILGTATGTNPNGSTVLPAIWALSTTVTLP
jgi:hypothetical protein